MHNLVSLEFHGNNLLPDLLVKLYDTSKLQLLKLAMQHPYSAECKMFNGTWVNTLHERQKGGHHFRLAKVWAVG